ncbi:hypothetical protein [Enemella evansiae]|uniref:hypothetical protein n=1 Tax=Enemella evansiae TaxID=2016499 RepID=UPI000B975A0E|nr:hypothetical protein [Enemella evansiae]OYO03370.1 hypothetical protein CGZ97_07850 [Enemella evansiae]
MDCSPLREAYRDLLAALRAVRIERLTDEQSADLDWTLAHLALSDAELTAAAEATGRDEPAVVDNAGAMDPERLGAWTGTRSLADRVAGLEAQAERLVTAVSRLDQPASGSPVTLRVHDRRGRFVEEQTITWVELVALRAERHLPGHTRRIEAYA